MNTGYKSVVFDNFSNSLTEILGRRQTVNGKGLHVVQGDIRNQAVRENRIRCFDCQLGGLLLCQPEGGWRVRRKYA